MYPSLFGSALFASIAVQSAFAALPTISVKGAKFFADGKQFFLKGHYPIFTLLASPG
jgi:hypothetical protein